MTDTIKWNVLIVLIYLVLLSVNYVFISAYIHSYRVSRYGDRKEVKVVAVLREPGGGHRSYKYRVECDGVLKEVYTKSELRLDASELVIISPRNKQRVFLLKENTGVISIFNGLTGGWFMSILLILIHLILIRISWKVCIQIPLEHLKGMSKRI